jgi:hypothetical protein
LHHSPWRLEASAGQRFNFTLIDFSRHGIAAPAAGHRDDQTGHAKPASGSGGGSGPASSSLSGSVSTSVCYAYAMFRETGAEGVTKTHTQCGSLTGERESLAYVSVTEKVQVTIIAGRGQPDTARQFLIRYNGLCSFGFRRLHFSASFHLF